MNQDNINNKSDILNQEDKTPTFKLTDYLQTPKKKRKKHIILAIDPKFDVELTHAIENYVKTQYPKFIFNLIKTKEDLINSFSKSISLLILDDELFDNLDELMQILLKAKRKSFYDEGMPILFLTNKQELLIKSYYKYLSAYQETDDLCPYKNLETVQILNRIKRGVEFKNKRRAKRYKINIDISFFHLNKDQTFKGKLLDLSLYGALLESPEIDMFRLNDQIKLNIPIGRFMSIEEGEFIKVSAKVKRVFVSGKKAGLVFEHMSDNTLNKLTELLTKIAILQISKPK